MITPAPVPKLIKRQAGNFVGYFFSDSEWVSGTCNGGGTYSESKPYGLNNIGYGGCCYTATDCILPTTCNGGTLFGPGGASKVCGIGSSCITDIVATSQGAELNGAIYLECGNWESWVAYRTPPTDGSAPTTPSVTTPTSSSGIITSPSASSSHPLVPATSPPTPQPTSNGVSGAAIAGAVIGPICGVAIILGLAFLYFRRRAHAQQMAISNPQHPPPGSGPVSQGVYMTDKPGFVNASGPNSYRPTSVPPGYPGTGKTGTTVAANEVPSPVVPNDFYTPSPAPLGQQVPGQAAQQLQNYQTVGYMAGQNEMPTNPLVTGMPPELSGISGEHAEHVV